MAFFQAFLLQIERMGQTFIIFSYHKGPVNLYSAGNLSLGNPGIWWERTEHPIKSDDAITICLLKYLFTSHWPEVVTNLRQQTNRKFC